MPQHWWEWPILVATLIAYTGLGWVIWRIGLLRTWDLINSGIKRGLLRLLEGAPPARTDKDRIERDRIIRQLESELGIGDKDRHGPTST